MSTSRFALFVDLENCGAKVATLNNILEKVKIRGDILLGKVYGYTDQFKDLKEILLSNTFTVVPSLRYGISQKNNADILLVIDALEVAYTNPLIDSFCIVSGDSDYTPLVGRLKSMGKFVLGISRSEVGQFHFYQRLQRVSVSGFRSPRQPGTSAAPRSRASDEPLVRRRGSTSWWRAPFPSKRTRTKCTPASSRACCCACGRDFNEKAFGCASFGKLLNKLAGHQVSAPSALKNDNYNVLVSLNADAPDSPGKKAVNPRQLARRLRRAIAAL